MDHARWEYVNNILSEGLENKNSKPYWRFIKSRRQDNIGIAPLKKEGILHTENKEKARILNHQFQQVFTREDDSPMPTPAGPSFPSAGKLVVNANGVTKLLSSLKVNKASGPDDLPCRILKELAEDIAPVLTSIFNQIDLYIQSVAEVWHLTIGLGQSKHRSYLQKREHKPGRELQACVIDKRLLQNFGTYST
jgi:hypothetical protein